MAVCDDLRARKTALESILPIIRASIVADNGYLKVVQDRLESHQMQETDCMQQLEDIARQLAENMCDSTNSGEANDSSGMQP